MKKKELRQKLFDIYSENYEQIYQSQNWTYLGDHFTNPNISFYTCPLCFVVMNKSDLNQTKDNPLTLEDIPPKSLGGRALVLTCKRCNNEAGSQFDSVLKKFIEYEFFSTGDIALDFNLSIDDSKPFKSKFTYTKSTKTINVNHNKSNPYANKQMKQMKENWGEGTITFSRKMGKMDDVHSAVTRFAYLYCFYFFGYCFAFSDGGKYINSLLEEKKKLIDFIPLVYDENILEKEGVFRVLILEEFECLLVVLKFKLNGHEKLIGVLLPGPFKKDVEIYKLIKTKKKITLQYIEYKKFNLSKSPNELVDTWE